MTGIVPHVSFSLISSFAAQHPQSVQTTKESNRPPQTRKDGFDWTKSFYYYNKSRRSSFPEVKCNIRPSIYLIEELYICGLNIITSMWQDYQFFSLSGSADGG